jgi:diguanylate cyclase (GGDEF)-like protein
VLQFSGKHFDFNRFRYVLVLAFVVAVVVTGCAAYIVESLHAPDVLWQSLAIGILVAAGAGWTTAGRSKEDFSPHSAIGPANDESSSRTADYAAAGAGVLQSLEEQGITVKLLELTALGDRYGNIFSVALIGVDHLEDIVEQYEKDVTGRLLAKVSGALAETLRMPDRVGEFEHGTYLVVLPETTLRGAIQIAERLRDAVSGLDVAVSDRIHIHTTASVGVTSFRRGDDLQSLVGRAENALRAAQNQGRNRVLPDMAA